MSQYDYHGNARDRRNRQRGSMKRFACSGACLLGSLIAGCRSDTASLVPARPPDSTSQSQSISGSSFGLGQGAFLNSSKAARLLEQALASYRAGRLDESRQLLFEARRIDPLLTSTWEVEARVAFDQQDVASYEAALKALAAAHPQSAPIQHDVGVALLWSGHDEEGLRALEQARQLNPRDAGFVRDLDAAHVRQGNIPEARVLLVEFEALQPGVIASQMLLGTLAEQEHDWERAEQHYGLVIAENQESVFAFSRRARCRYELGWYHAALSDYGRCEQLASGQLTIADMVYRADACLRVGELEQADRVLLNLAERHDRPVREIDILRGLCAWKQHDLHGARQIWQQALDVWPDDANLRWLNELVATELQANNGAQAAATHGERAPADTAG